MGKTVVFFFFINCLNVQKTLNGITIKTKGTKSLGILLARFQIKVREFGLSDAESYAWLCVGLKVPIEQGATEAHYESACEKLQTIQEELFV